MDCDFLIIGGGIAGASVAYELSAQGRVVLVERESTPGYHTTGRSAAMYLENYGERAVRRLASASRAFFDDPPQGFAEHPMLIRRGVLFIARADQRDGIEAALAANRNSPGALEPIDAARAREMVPALCPEYVAAAALEADASDIDVHALHGGYLRGLKRRGGQVLTDADVTALDNRDCVWRTTTTAGEVSAPTVVNAAGAWADEVARLAGAAPVGLVPKRRTAITFNPPAEFDTAGWPLTIDIDEQFYFKPEAGRILASPADETPMPPCDIQPDEFDVAVTVDRIERATTFRIRSLTHRWAGLRSFVADHIPVIGYDPDAPGFFWLAGQGGVGIMTAPATARLAAALAIGGEPPADIRESGVSASDVGPGRLRR